MNNELRFHPLAEVFPLLEGDEFDALVADIKANGLREKIDLYEGKIVDGRNRYLALHRLGIDPSPDDKKYFRKALYTHTTGGNIAPHEQSNDDRVRAYVISKNIHRRHLTAEQKRGLIAELIQAQPENSNRQIAKAAKVDHKTVAAARAELEGRGEIPHVETTTDTKGRKQPAKKKRKAKKSAALDDDQTKQPPRAEVAKLVRAWVQASPEAKREFVRERWDEIALIRKQLDANGVAHEDRWMEGDTL
jgi:cysteinyl-tRNA synthetase